MAAVLRRCLQAISRFASHFVLMYLPRLCNLLFQLTVFLFTLFKNMPAPFPCGNEPGKLSHGTEVSCPFIPSLPYVPARGTKDFLRSGSCRKLQHHALIFSDLGSWLHILEHHCLCPQLRGPGVTFCLYIHKDSWDVPR